MCSDHQCVVPICAGAAVDCVQIINVLYPFVQELLPLVFMFELSATTGLLQTLPDASSPVIQQLQQVYNVTVTFKQRPRMPITTVIVRGSVINAKSVKEATGKLMESLTGMVSTDGESLTGMVSTDGESLTGMVSSDGKPDWHGEY